MEPVTPTGGDNVSGDKITVGTITGGVVAIGAGAQANVYNFQETPPPPPRQSLNVTSSEYFTARESEISWLLDALQPARVVTLWGPGGIGKSAVAQAVLERLSPTGEPPQDFPDGVIVYSFYGQPDTLSFAAHIVRSLVGETAQDISPTAAQRALSAKKLLLVLDGTEETADLGAVLGLCTDNGVLLTTRDKGDAPASQWRLAITRLTLDDAWALLQKWAIDGLSEPLGRQICQFVDGWPLAVQIIGRYLDATGESPQDYWTWLQSAPIEALHFGQHQVESAAALLDRSLNSVSEEAKQILSLFGLLAPAPIAGEIITTSFALPNRGTQRGIGELVRYGLLRRQEKQLEAGHALIHSYARRQPPPAQEVVSALAANIQEKVESLTSIPVLLFEWLPHFRAVTDYRLERAEDAEAAALCNSLGKALHRAADYPNAQIYLERALVIREKVLGPDDPNTAQSLNNLGLLLHDQGDSARARPYIERAFAIRKKVLVPDHPDIADSLNNLGGLLDTQGNYVEARLYYERALIIREKAFGPDHAITAASLNNLGGLLAAQGNYAEARPLYERALAIQEKTLGPDHPDIAINLNNLGSLLQAQGNFAEARSNYERALAVREKKLGPEHPNTAASLNILGFLLFIQGDYAGARPFYERALAVREKALGPDHPDTANSLNNLGGLLAAQKNNEEARLCFQRALAVFEETLGPNHPNTRVVRENLNSL